MNRNIILSFGLLVFLVTISGIQANKASVYTFRIIAKLLVGQCRRKYGISNKMLEDLNKGNFPDNRNLKCYTNCALEKTGSVSGTKLNYEDLMKLIDRYYPSEMKASTKKAVTACRDAMNGFKDKCDASYNYIKCTQKNNPKDFYFP